MFRRVTRIAALLLLSCTLMRGMSPGISSARAIAGPPSAIRGLWRNPMRTVEVRIEECGQQLCGVVVGAAGDAIADARDSGYPNLIGMELMRDYRADRPGHWVGTVFVPDLGHSFSSHIELIDANHARIAGCLWRQHFCKSQVWERL